MSLDWIEVYAEARVAFPADVSLRTEDHGRVKITAYRREREPPLPPDLVGEERIYALSFVVAHDTPMWPWLVKRAARQWAARP